MNLKRIERLAKRLPKDMSRFLAAEEMLVSFRCIDSSRFMSAGEKRTAKRQAREEIEKRYGKGGNQ